VAIRCRLLLATHPNRLRVGLRVTTILRRPISRGRRGRSASPRQFHRASTCDLATAHACIIAATVFWRCRLAVEVRLSSRRGKPRGLKDTPIPPSDFVDPPEGTALLVGECIEPTTIDHDATLTSQPETERFRIGLLLLACGHFDRFGEIRMFMRSRHGAPVAPRSLTPLRTGSILDLRVRHSRQCRRRSSFQ
jgi:hypothetical protein